MAGESGERQFSARTVKRLEILKQRQTGRKSFLGGFFCDNRAVSIAWNSMNHRGSRLALSSKCAPGAITFAIIKHEHWQHNAEKYLLFLQAW